MKRTTTMRIVAASVALVATIAPLANVEARGGGGVGVGCAPGGGGGGGGGNGGGGGMGGGGGNGGGNGGGHDGGGHDGGHGMQYAGWRQCRYVCTNYAR